MYTVHVQPLSLDAIVDACVPCLPNQAVMLFQGDVKFLKCKSAGEGRVFYLYFQNERREFFWMQNLSADKDEEHMKAVNSAINGTATCR